MAITKNAKKAIRTSERKRVFNLRRTPAMREVVKAVKKTASSGDVASAKAKLSSAYAAIDKAAKRGVIKANTAARKKSRLVAAIKKAEQHKK